MSGLYKKPDFKIVAAYEGKPVVFDDTCYFVGCESEEKAQHRSAILNSSEVREFYNSLILWDAKRPITADILSELSLDKGNNGRLKFPD